MDQATLVRALSSLGVQMQTLEQLRLLPFHQAAENLKQIQESARPVYKKLAFELHPDRTGGDQAKTQLFTEVTTVHKWLQELKIQAPPPRPVMTVQFTHYPRAHPFGGTVTSTTTSTGFSHPYNAHRVVFIKVS